MQQSSRLWIGRALQVALAVLVVVIAGAWVRRHLPSRNHVRVEGENAVPETLGPGDARLYTSDSAVDLVLSGDHISGGLSAKTLAKVRQDLDTSDRKETGLGGSIARVVKSTVASAIGTRVQYPLSDIRDIRVDGGRLVVDWKDGGDHHLFGGVTVNGGRVDDSFRPDEAKRFVDAVRARKKELGQM